LNISGALLLLAGGSGKIDTPDRRWSGFKPKAAGIWMLPAMNKKINVIKLAFPSGKRIQQSERTERGEKQV